ncbi:hypothetical protein H632_c423p0, partial [Helicosporidium sp. ATCC 50920]
AGVSAADASEAANAPIPPAAPPEISLRPLQWPGTPGWPTYASPYLVPADAASCRAEAAADYLWPGDPVESAPAAEDDLSAVKKAVHLGDASPRAPLEEGGVLAQENAGSL